MVLHVKDEETDMLVRQLAEARRVGITTAIKDAVKDALTRHRSKRSLWDDTADIRAMFAQYPKTGQVADKAFYDELSGHIETDPENK
jgi:antitoxin VapB